MNLEQLRKLCFNTERFPKKVLDWIGEENLWNLWVPKRYGGLGAGLTEGLDRLYRLARIDGSLGWTVTLCAGANFFIGNLRPEIARELFGNPKNPVCFGGSGGVFGTAVKEGDDYLISGRWRYATGAPYLTHFTLNAKIMKNGKELKNADGSPLVRSFLLPKSEVGIIADWNAMGLKATATHSFEVISARVHEKYSFGYQEVYLPDPLFKVPFPIFADLTLWVNYIGMTEHFLEGAAAILPEDGVAGLLSIIERAQRDLMGLAKEMENKAAAPLVIANTEIYRIHLAAVTSVRLLTKGIMEYYPLLGIQACSEDHGLNQVFRDYFTATQHHIFTKTI